MRPRLLVVIAAVAAMVSVPGARAATRPVTAEPTTGPLISGTTSLVGGTDVWTDYAYDDRGTNAGSAGSYPAEAAPGNAADLIQLQLTPTARSLRIRAVLETLTNPKAPLLGVGIDADADPHTGAAALPGWTVHGTPLGLERLVVVGAGGAKVLAWTGAGWKRVGTAPAAVSAAANTMTTAVPISSLGRTSSRWRVVGVLGLGFADQSWVDGKGPVYDLAYVRDTSSSNFQSNVQAAVLSGTADAALAEPAIDLTALRRGVTRIAGPVLGVKNTFLYRSRLDLGEGIRSGNSKYAGPYQPYGICIPPGLPAHPPMVLFIHGSGLDHLSGGPYCGDGDFIPGTGIGPGQIAPRAVMATPLARLEMGTNDDGPAEQDILDVLHDVERRLSVDTDRVVLSGYSLGGVGAFRLAELYPDLWAGVVEIVGAPQLGAITTEEELQGQQTLPNDLENLRNIRLRMAHSRADELELLVSDQPDQTFVKMEQLGYDFRYWQFQRRDHLTFPVAAVQCEMEAAIKTGRLHDPDEVVYSRDPAMYTHDPRIGLDLHHDHAYWMSDLVVRGSHFAPGDKGTVDVTNLTRPYRVPKVTAVSGVDQNVTSGRDVCGPNPKVQTDDVWTTLGNAWSRGDRQPTTNGLRVALTKVALVRLDLAQMHGLDTRRPLTVQVSTDGRSVLRLAAGWPGAVAVTGDGPVLRVCPRHGEIAVPVAASTTLRLTATGSPC